MSRSGARVQRVIWSVVVVVVAVLCGNTRGQPPDPVSKRDCECNGGSDGHRVQVNQIDLLSGTPTLLVAIAAFIQILPLPVDVYKPRLMRFLDWLRFSVEQEFGITLHTCHGQCLGCKYQPTPYLVKEWVSVSAGVNKPIDCAGPDVLSMDDLAQIIQMDGNGDILLHLARLTRYPRIPELTRGVWAIQYSPHAGRRFVAFQWLGLFLSYAYHLVFFNELVDMVQAITHFLAIVYRRTILSLPPSDRHDPTCISLGYRMADLTRHCILHSHLQWVRYGVYGMLMKMAGKTISLEFRNGIPLTDIYGNRHVGGKKLASHPNRVDSLFAQNITADACSAAQLLYSIAFHSVRVMLLCSELGFPPLQFITGSFLTTGPSTISSAIFMHHPALADTYRALYSPNSKQHNSFVTDFSLLLKLLQSPLGSLIVDEWSLSIKLGLQLRLLPDSAYLAPEETSGSGSLTTIDPYQQTGFHVDGILIEPLEVSQLVQAQYRVIDEIYQIAVYSGTQRRRWGTRAWMVFFLLESLDGLVAHESAHVDGNPAGTLLSLQCWLRLVCMSHFQPVFGVPKEDQTEPLTHNDDSFQDEWRNISSEWFGMRENYTRSPPAWCICQTHCRGLCTLLVEHLIMGIDAGCYDKIPCTFYSKDFVRGKYGDVLKLVCANHWNVIRGEDTDQGSNQGLQQRTNPHPMSRFDTTEFLIGMAIYADTTRPAAIIKDKIILNCSIREESSEAKFSIPMFYSYENEGYLVYRLYPRLGEFSNCGSDNHALLGGITGLSTGRLQHNAAVEAQRKRSVSKPIRNK